MQRTAVTLFVLALGSTSRAQSVLQTLGSGSFVQHPMRSVGDLNSDGYLDWLVGQPDHYPGWFQFFAGRAVIVNGKRFATANAPMLLATIDCDAVGGDNAGHAVTLLGDLNNDGRNDFAIGMPRLSSSDPGSVALISGASYAVLGKVTSTHAGDEFGYALARAGDVDDDGKNDLLVGAPSDDWAGVDAGRAYVVSGAALLSSSANFALHVFAGSQAGAEMGAAVDGLADFDHDYEMDFVIASPGFDFFAADTGLVRVYSGASFAPMWMTFGAAGDRMGTSVDIAPDLNGDGYVELAVAAPFRDAGANDGGSVMVYTGTSIHSGGPATVLHELRSGITQAHMGQSVQIVLDVNGDGTSDVLCGAPDYDSPFGGADHGAVWIYSGATGARLGWLIGAANQRLGATLGGGDEFDGNGFNDFVCDGNVSASLFPALGWTYCTGKTNSHGCVPAVSTLGQASATSSAAFYVRGSQFLNQHSGHLFYGFAPAQAPFQGGFKCVASPTHRTPSQSSGGTAAPAVDCSGQYAVDFKALIQSHVDPVLVAGREVFCQYYARDPQSVAGSSLSNATNFVIGP